jgi:TonB-linked SusC/RagA family outer membrane protein
MKNILLRRLIVMSRSTFYGLILQVLLIGLLRAADLSAQPEESIDNIKVTISFKDASLKEVFSDLERQTDFYFAYEKSVLNEKYKITLSSKSISLSEVLRLITRETDLSFKRINTTIHVTKARGTEKAAIDNSPINGQALLVSGTVQDPGGVTLPGVNVLLKGTTFGTSTDANGQYSLELPDGEGTLVFSFIGYASTEVAVNNRTVIDVILEYDIQTLGEVVVIGYGTLEKKDLTGAVSSVNSERLNDIPATNIAGALQGSVSGVSISTPFGAPGAQSSILIRGLNSINASNDPLIVVDGIPGASLNDIHPSDIASIDVLKDAASTAIYGSRATNGVIIITTRTGKGNKLSVTYNGYMGFSEPLKKVDVLDAGEYVTKRREIYRMQNGLTAEQAAALTAENIFGSGNELDMYNLGKSYDWQEDILQSAPQHSHNLSLSGGNEKTRYYMAASMLGQKGIVQSSAFNRYSLRANIDSDVTPWLKLGTNLFITKTKQDNVQDGVFAASYQISPLGKKYEDEENPGKYTLYPMNPDNFITNPFTDMTLDDKVNRTKFLNGTFVELKFLKDLKYRITANSILDFERSNFFAPFYTKLVESFERYEYAEIRDWDRQYLNIENLLSYSKKYGDHDIALTAVFSTEEYQQNYLRGYAKNFGSDYYGWTAMQLGQPDFFQVNSAEEEWFLESMVGRLNYSFKERYLLQATIRRDRSSKFSPKNREAIFPGVSVGWRISGERFMQNIEVINDLKIRISYAKTGNQGIDYRSIYNVGNKVRYTLNTGVIVEGFDQTSLGNKDLKWEQSAQFNAGLDFQLLKGRLSGSLETYQTKTEDLLMTKSIQHINGFQSILTNVGSVKNKGIELTLNGRILETSNFKMSANATFSKNRNEITELYGDGVDDIANRWFIGESLGVVYDFVFDGILQSGETAPAYMDNTVGTVGDGKNIVPGEAKVKDIGSFQTLGNGAVVPVLVPDGLINEADMTIIGSTQPKWFGSFGMQFKYKNVDASFFLNHVHGTLRQVPLNVNQRTHMLNLPYYTDENPSLHYGRPAWPSTIDGVARTGNQFGRLSYYEDGTYTRLQDITIGYTFDKLSRLNIGSLRIYVTGQNLLTITDFSGYDPSLSYTNNQTNAEISRIAGYPTSRNFIMGVNVNF